MDASRTQNGEKNSWENLKRVSGRENKSEPKRKITNNRVTDRGKHEKKKKKNMEDGGKHEETGRTVEDEAIGSGSGQLRTWWEQKKQDLGRPRVVVLEVQRPNRPCLSFPFQFC